MDGKTPNRLISAFTHRTWAGDPSVSSNKTIVFVSRTNEMDGTNMRYSQVRQPFVSLDGSRVVFLANNHRKYLHTLWFVNSDGTGLTEIPWGLEELDKPTNFN